MERGRILVASWEGAFIMRLQGDIRLTFCAALEAYIRQLLTADECNSLVIDLQEAENVDSTTLGQLAKLAMAVHKRWQVRPVMVSTRSDINRLLESMAFARIVDVRTTPPCTEAEVEALVEQLPIVRAGEAEVHERVLEAHRVLMGMSQTNHAQFRDLVATLESSRPGTC